MTGGPLDATLIVIPARNEAATIGTVIRTIAAQGPFHVLVVNDGSTDATARLAREAGAKVLTLPLPLGAWGAMQTGILYADRKDYRQVVTMDADGQHEPRFLEALLGLLSSGAIDVAIGAYPERGSRARKIAWAFFKYLTGFSIEDLTSGFRAYNHRAIRVLAGREATLLDYQDIGVLLLLRNAGMNIVELPVAMQLRKTGRSRIFSSWWAVARYMAETTILCLAHWQVMPKQGTKVAHSIPLD